MTRSYESFCLADTDDAASTTSLTSAFLENDAAFLIQQRLRDFLASKAFHRAAEEGCVISQRGAAEPRLLDAGPSTPPANESASCKSGSSRRGSKAWWCVLLLAFALAITACVCVGLQKRRTLWVAPLPPPPPPRDPLGGLIKGLVEGGLSGAAVGGVAGLLFPMALPVEVAFGGIVGGVLGLVQAATSG